MEQLRALLLIKLGDPALVDLPAEQRPSFNSQAERLELDRLMRAIKLFNQAALDLRGGWQPQLPLELALVEALQSPTAPVTGTPASTPSKPASAPTRVSPVANKRTEPAAGPAQPVVNQPAAPLAAQSASTPASASTVTAEQVLAVWDGVLSAIKARSIPTEALLKSCHVNRTEHNTVVLSWPSGTLKDRFEGSKHQRQLAGWMFWKNWSPVVFTNSWIGTPLMASSSAFPRFFPSLTGKTP